MCPKCGFANQPGFQFCTNCGASMAAMSPYSLPATPPAGYPPPGYPSAGYPPAYGAGPSPWEYERTRQVDRTKTGILLLLIGTLVSWVPVIGAIGLLLIFIGAILVIMGRKAFGPTHSRDVVVAIVLFFAGIIAIVVVVVIVAINGVAGYLTSSSAIQQAAIEAAAQNGALVSGITSALITGLATVFFTYALQQRTGKVLLWAAYGANIALSVAVYIVVAPMVSQALANSVASGAYDAAGFASVIDQKDVLAYLGVIPALLYTGANYLAWSRLKRGEIPEPPGGAVPSPYRAPPYTPPQVPPPGGAMPPTPPSTPP